MAETVQATPAVSTKTPKKKSAAKKNASGPKLSDLIVQVVSESKDRKGTSLYALKKGLEGKGYNVDGNKSRIKTAIKSLEQKCIIVRTRASFKLVKKKEVKKKPIRAKATATKAKRSPAKLTAKPVPKKKKKPAAKKTVAKKTVAKKTKIVKKSKAKSPRKPKIVKSKVKKISRSTKAVKKVAKPKTKLRKSTPKKK